MSATNQTLPPDLLKGVSRSFYLTLRFLPSGVRPQIGLAYLLARMTAKQLEQYLNLRILEHLAADVGTQSSFRDEVYLPS